MNVKNAWRHFALKGIFLVNLCGLLIFVSSYPASAQNIPPGQTAGSLEKARGQIREQQKFEEKALEEKKKPEIEGEKKVEPAAPVEKPAVSKERVLISAIEVTGVKAVSRDAIRNIVAPYEGKELSLDDFEAMAQAITDLYREEGYVTSVAYLPPQKISENKLTIEVLEGKTGKITWEGNKYFSAKLLSSYLDLKKGEIFNYDTLRKNITTINSHPDRNVRVVLARGEERGESDMNMFVSEQFPFHMTMGYNNYNSRYLYRNRYQFEAKATNLWGRDHIASGEFQFGDGGAFYLYSGRYMAPLGADLSTGASYIHIDQKLMGALKNSEVTGKGDVASWYYSYKCISTENISLTANTAFDYKQIENSIEDSVQSRDNTRTIKVGFDLDMADFLRGRTIVTQEFDVGLPGFLGGLSAKDSKASRAGAGAGGEFFKSVTNIARVQSLPASMTLMLRGSLQLTSQSLVYAEQFNIGGPTTVRGYPLSEYTGDNGITASSELYVPPFFVPKDIKVPYTKTSFFDATRLVGFFDWGYVHNRVPQTGESRDKSLYAIGSGIRFDIPNLNSTTLDLGYGLGVKPSDKHRLQVYVSTKMFF